MNKKVILPIFVIMIFFFMFIIRQESPLLLPHKINEIFGTKGKEQHAPQLLSDVSQKITSRSDELIEKNIDDIELAWLSSLQRIINDDKIFEQYKKMRERVEKERLEAFENDHRNQQHPRPMSEEISPEEKVVIEKAHDELKNLMGNQYSNYLKALREFNQKTIEGNQNRKIPILIEL